MLCTTAAAVTLICCMMASFSYHQGWLLLSAPPMSASLRPAPRAATACLRDALRAVLMAAPLVLASLPLQAANQAGTFNAMVRTLLIRRHAAAANQIRHSPTHYFEMKGQEAALTAQLKYYKALLAKR